MRNPKKRRDGEPCFWFRFGLTGFEASASGSVAVVAAALLAVIAILVLHLPFLR